MSLMDELVVKEKLVVDCKDTAGMIEYEMIDYFKPSPKGIYTASKLEPVMVDGVQYYEAIWQEGISVKYIEIKDITQHEGSVYFRNKSDFMVRAIPKTFMKNKAKYLSNTPIIPYAGTHITNLLVREQIDNYVQYSRSTSSLKDKIRAYVLDEVSDENFEIMLSRMRELYECTHELVKEFIHGFDWYLFFTKLNENKITIERSIDYRAYLYLESKYKNE